MGLIKQHLSAELDFYRSNGIRVLHSGDEDGLPQDIVARDPRGRGRDRLIRQDDGQSGDQLWRPRRDRPRGQAPLPCGHRAQRGGVFAGPWTIPSCPIPTSSSGRATRCACPISCSGNPPTPSCGSRKVLAGLRTEDLATAIDAYKRSRSAIWRRSMSNVLQRLLLFFLGIPLVLAADSLSTPIPPPRRSRHILVFTGGCSLELSASSSRETSPSNPRPLVASALGIPASAYIGGLLAGDAAFRGLPVVSSPSGLCLLVILLSASPSSRPGHPRRAAPSERHRLSRPSIRASWAPSSSSSPRSRATRPNRS